MVLWKELSQATWHPKWSSKLCGWELPNPCVLSDIFVQDAPLTLLTFTHQQWEFKYKMDISLMDLHCLTLLIDPDAWPYRFQQGIADILLEILASSWGGCGFLWQCTTQGGRRPHALPFLSGDSRNIAPCATWAAHFHLSLWSLPNLEKPWRI